MVTTTACTAAVGELQVAGRRWVLRDTGRWLRVQVLRRRGNRIDARPTRGGTAPFRGGPPTSTSSGDAAYTSSPVAGRRRTPGDGISASTTVLARTRSDRCSSTGPRGTTGHSSPSARRLLGRRMPRSRPGRRRTRALNCCGAESRHVTTKTGRAPASTTAASSPRTQGGPGEGRPASRISSTGCRWPRSPWRRVSSARGPRCGPPVDRRRADRSASPRGRRGSFRHRLPGVHLDAGRDQGLRSGLSARPTRRRASPVSVTRLERLDACPASSTCSIPGPPTTAAPTSSCRSWPTARWPSWSARRPVPPGRASHSTSPVRDGGHARRGPCRRGLHHDIRPSNVLRRRRRGDAGGLGSRRRVASTR